jgi:hypothetical protein
MCKALLETCPEFYKRCFRYCGRAGSSPSGYCWQHERRKEEEEAFRLEIEKLSRTFPGAYYIHMTIENENGTPWTPTLAPKDPVERIADALEEIRDTLQFALCRVFPAGVTMEMANEEIQNNQRPVRPGPLVALANMQTQIIQAQAEEQRGRMIQMIGQANAHNNKRKQ